MTETQHTPPAILALPYELSDMGIIYGAPKADDSSTFVADLELEESSEEQVTAERARGKFIVESCNAYYQLLEKVAGYEKALNEIATMTLWGEPLKDEDLKSEAIDAGEYDEDEGVYNPSCDSESNMLRDAVETARAAIAKTDGGAA
jgi:hypothetical protein